MLINSKYANSAKIFIIDFHNFSIISYQIDHADSEYDNNNY